jgi:tripartite-type tricarboxylate transporter receptor subunit TctC
MRTPAMICIAFAVGVTLGDVGSATAQDYPSRPITMIVPGGAGGTPDVIARILAERLRTTLGQPVIIENVGGADGSIAVGRVARATPDGYTLSIGTVSTHVVNGAAYSLSYDVLNDFEPIGLLPSLPLLIVINRTMPARNLDELIAWLKANPDKASQGIVGTTSHLAGAFFKKMTETRFQFVPYRVVGSAMQDLIAGRIEMMFTPASNALGPVRNNQIKALAVTAKNRMAVAADIPTVDEAGLAGLHLSIWQAVWAPKGTPLSIVAKLNSAFVEALADAMVQRRVNDIGQEIPAFEQQTPEALRAYQKTEIDKWWPIIKAANIKGE